MVSGSKLPLIIALEGILKMDKQNRKEVIIISSVALIVLIVDCFVVPYLIKKGDTVTSGWNPIRGQAAVSLNAMALLILDLLLFVLLYTFFKYILDKFSKNH